MSDKKNKTEQILEQIKKQRSRSRVIAAEEERIELVIFSLAKDYYAFYGTNVKEILPYEKITYVPGCPDFITGIINIRGDIESVISIHKLMGIPEKKPDKNFRIIMGVHQDILSGILVDSVEDVIEVPLTYIKHPISTLDKKIKDFTVGGEMIYENKYVNILDIGKLFSILIQ
ncbi:Chemotaxis protein [Desulfonema limicola]|uniref:Chemotaxis protein n=1 Tax=Desulfonema limicola TaxID=45656 RepID=A0A975GI32_9BACT|nr:chemotaxis protein CheW [Desulfonema limicola]QTA82106.1 Chemotaxis protein [Desulfonema limicola]